jgi:hypothetical protein
MSLRVNNKYVGSAISSSSKNPLQLSNTCCNITKLCFLATECVYVLRMILAINSDCFHKQRRPLGLCSGYVVFHTRYGLKFYVLPLRGIPIFNPAWEFAAETHLLKLQRPQNRVLNTIGNFPRRASVCDMHVALQILSS